MLSLKGICFVEDFLELTCYEHCYPFAEQRAFDSLIHHEMAMLKQVLGRGRMKVFVKALFLQLF